MFLLMFVASAQASNCPELYPNSKPIKISNTIELCNSFYVTLFDTTRGGPILTSERLKVNAPVGSLNRKESFRPDLRLGNRSPQNSQYVRTGFDRGHMVPSDDASTEKEMADTYLLSNMTPQNPKLNRIQWAKLEKNIRNLHKNSTEDTYIVTIAVYHPPLQTINGLPIPTEYWKIIHKGKSKIFYKAENMQNAEVRRSSSEPPVHLLVR